MIKAIIGTAGHVDHGKTALLKSLTGIDCDRLPEEKEREITIDLGFAHLKTEDIQIGFIDVPGHERFIKNLLAGVSGFQYFLFCIALDEGIKPQTIEHLQILKTLGIKKGIIALTKMDLVDEETIKRRQLEIFYLFEGEGFEKLPILPVSAIKNKNIENLKKEITNLIKENPIFPNLDPPVLYPIDRVFTLSGKGIVVTGTLLRGIIKLNDELILNPLGKKIKIREIEVHKEKREIASAVERVALLISGIEKENLKRGLILSDISLPRSKILTVKGSLIKEIKNDTRLRIAHHTNEVYGRFYKIDEKLAQVFLEEPENVLRGDKIILRRYSPPEFFGAGEIVDIFLEKIKREEKIELGKSLEEDMEFWLKRAGFEGVEKDNLWERSGYYRRDNFEKILKNLDTVQHSPYLWHKKNYQKLKSQTFQRIEDYKNNNPGTYSMPLKLAFNFLKKNLNENILQEIALDFGLQIEKGNIILKEKDELSQEQNLLLENFKKFGLKPPELEIMSMVLNIPLNILKKITKELVQRGFLVQVSVGYYVEKDILLKAIEKLKSTGWEKFTIAEFKELFGLTRKYAVPLLEYLDSQRITIRTKEFRILKK